MQEVLVSCLILYTVRLLVNRLAGALPAPPRAAAPAAAGAAPAVAAAAAQPGAAGAAAAADELAVRKARSEEAEGEGIKYEGYAEAIAAAQVRYREAAACCLAGLLESTAQHALGLARLGVKRATSRRHD